MLWKEQNLQMKRGGLGRYILDEDYIETSHKTLPTVQSVDNIVQGFTVHRIHISIESHSFYLLAPSIFWILY